MPIDPLPSISRSDANFRTQVDDYFLTRLPAFSTQAESARAQIVAAESTTTSAASNAATAATTATTAAGTATSASASAVTAKNAAEAAAANAISTPVAAPIHAAASKTTPANADELGITDSAASWGLKKLTFANLNAWIGGLFVSKSGDTINGDLNFSGVGRRITGNFSDTTLSNQLLVQTNVPDSPTGFYITPNGAGGSSAIGVFNQNNPDDSQLLYLYVDSVSTGISSIKTGGAGYLPMIFQTGGAERLRIDTTGNVLVMGGGGLGYGVGAGGTASQPGQNGGSQAKNLAVSLNKSCGQITMGNASLASGAVVTFQLTNLVIANSDHLIATLRDDFSPANYAIRCSVGTGGGRISLTNISGGSLAEAVVLNFMLIKGATS